MQYVYQSTAAFKNFSQVNSKYGKTDWDIYIHKATYTRLPVSMWPGASSMWLPVCGAWLPVCGGMAPSMWGHPVYHMLDAPHTTYWMEEIIRSANTKSKKTT